MTMWAPYASLSFYFQDTVLDILATVQNLLRRCVQPSAFLRPLSMLFSVIHDKLPRKALTSAFQVPLSKIPPLVTTQQIFF